MDKLKTSCITLISTLLYTNPLCSSGSGWLISKNVALDCVNTQERQTLMALDVIILVEDGERPVGDWVYAVAGLHGETLPPMSETVRDRSQANDQ